MVGLWFMSNPGKVKEELGIRVVSVRGDTMHLRQDRSVKGPVEWRERFTLYRNKNDEYLYRTKHTQTIQGPLVDNLTSTYLSKSPTGCSVRVSSYSNFDGVSAFIIRGRLNKALAKMQDFLENKFGK